MEIRIETFGHNPTYPYQFVCQDLLRFADHPVSATTGPYLSLSVDLNPDWHLEFNPDVAAGGR
jgi:hypothetical protein